jgi:hypothetical protein
VAPKGPGLTDRIRASFKELHEQLKHPDTARRLVLNQIRWLGTMYLVQGNYAWIVGMLLYFGGAFALQQVLIWLLTEILFALYLIPRVL